MPWTTTTHSIVPFDAVAVGHAQVHAFLKGGQFDADGRPLDWLRARGWTGASGAEWTDADLDYAATHTAGSGISIWAAFRRYLFEIELIGQGPPDPPPATGPTGEQILALGEEYGLIHPRMAPLTKQKFIADFRARGLTIEGFDSFAQDWDEARADDDPWKPFATVPLHGAVELAADPDPLHDLFEAAIAEAGEAGTDEAIEAAILAGQEFYTVVIAGNPASDRWRVSQREVRASLIATFDALYLAKQEPYVNERRRLIAAAANASVVSALAVGDIPKFSDSAFSSQLPDWAAKKTQQD